MPRDEFVVPYAGRVDLVANVSGAFCVCMSYGELHSLWQAFTDAGRTLAGDTLFGRSTVFTLEFRTISINPSRSCTDCRRRIDAVMQKPCRFCTAGLVMRGTADEAGDVWFSAVNQSQNIQTMKAGSALRQNHHRQRTSRRNRARCFGGSGSTLIAAEQGRTAVFL